MLGLIPLLLQGPLVLGNAREIWGLSAPKTYLSTQVPFSTGNLQVGE